MIWAYQRNAKWWEVWKRRAYVVYPMGVRSFILRGFTKKSARTFVIHENMRGLWHYRLEKLLHEISMRDAERRTTFPNSQRQHRKDISLDGRSRHANQSEPATAEVVVSNVPTATVNAGISEPIEGILTTEGEA